MTTREAFSHGRAGLAEWEVELLGFHAPRDQWSASRRNVAAYRLGRIAARWSK